MSIKGSDIIASQEKASAEYIEAMKEGMRLVREARFPMVGAYIKDCERLVYATKSVTKEEFAEMYPDKGEG